MSKEYNLISDFDYRIIAAFFAGLDRQGPGDDAQTRRALSFIDGLPPRPRIADIGCGTGRPTAGAAMAAAETPNSSSRACTSSDSSRTVKPLISSIIAVIFSDIVIASYL